MTAQAFWGYVGIGIGYVLLAICAAKLLKWRLGDDDHDG